MFHTLFHLILISEIIIMANYHLPFFSCFSLSFQILDETVELFPGTLIWFPGNCFVAEAGWFTFLFTFCFWDTVLICDNSLPFYFHASSGQNFLEIKVCITLQLGSKLFFLFGCLVFFCLGGAMLIKSGYVLYRPNYDPCFHIPFNGVYLLACGGAVHPVL